MLAHSLRRAAPSLPPVVQMILMQHKQRHHLITQYIHNPIKVGPRRRGRQWGSRRRGRQWG